MASSKVSDSPPVDARTVLNTLQPGHSQFQGPFVLTAQIYHICSRVLPLLAKYPQPQNKGFILTGDRGVGKTRALQFLAKLLESPEGKDCKSLLDQLKDSPKPQKPLSSRSIPFPVDPSVDLGAYLIEQLSELSPSRPIINGSTAIRSLDEFAALAKQAARVQSPSSLGMVVLEDLWRLADRLETDEARGRDLYTLNTLLKALAEEGILMFFVFDEKTWQSNQKCTGSILPSEVLGSSCDLLSLSHSNAIEIVARSSAYKSDVQREDIRSLLRCLRQKNVYFRPRADVFTDLYPLHPHTFEVLFHLSRLLPGFSPLGYAEEAINAASARTDDKLIKLDLLFDHVLTHLKTQTEARAVLESYDELVVTGLSFLDSSVRGMALSLLKSIALLTVCRCNPPSVKILTNALLLFDDSDILSGYSMTAAIMMEIEQRAGQYLIAEGEGLARKYQLVNPRQQFGPAQGQDGAGGDEWFRVQFPLLFHEWLPTAIPEWQPHIGERYQRTSQSLVAPVPDVPSGPMGLVYLKSVFDPIWSAEDLTTLEEAQHNWAVLILSPYERFYELDQTLSKLAQRWENLIIWHPGSPTQRENESLKSVAARLDCNIDTELAPIAHAAEAMTTSGIPDILTSLYVERGHLIIASDHLCIGDEIGEMSLPEYLSQHLLTIANSHAPDLADASTVDKIEKGRAEAHDLAIRWASLLAGIHNYQSLNPGVAERMVVDWWIRIDQANLAQRIRHLPDDFLTIHFGERVETYENHLETIRRIFSRMREGQISFIEAMAQLSREFGHNEKRLESWKQLMDNLVALLRWMPGFEHARNYLCSAMPVLHEERLQQLHMRLMGSTERPQSFLEASERRTFDQEFLEFKKEYIDYYYSVHEDVLQIVGKEKMESKVDYTSLRNLELLSNLYHTDKSYVNRIRIIGKWVQENQCDLPVRQILERQPRCYCNFNPTASSHVGKSVEQMNAVIQEGLEYFRNILRRCKVLIIQELKNLNVSDAHSKQIAALLSRGAMIPLKSPCIEILNEIIQKHRDDFVAATRSRKSPQ